ncbi:hypothetical protein ACQPZU_06655 [Saccharomonospora azurea]|uniref:hypothetical protein n=1 Tax=Saccharomonospora azurea TaxID=40988 RepID=UPI00332A5FA0
MTRRRVPCRIATATRFGGQLSEPNAGRGPAGVGNTVVGGTLGTVVLRDPSARH